MKYLPKIQLIAPLAVGIASSTLSYGVTSVATLSDSIHAFGPSGNSDFYGSGNDGSGFEEYGIASFQYSASSDFGGTLVSIDSLSINLTYNDRNFTADGMIEFFFSSIPSADWTNLFYDSAFTTGIDPTQYGTHTPISLGQIPFMAIGEGTAGGDILPYMLTISTAAETALLSAINSDTEFSILVGGIDPTVEATFSGVGNIFDPGDPELDITATTTGVPEPSSLFIAILGTVPFVLRRTRKCS